MLASKQVFCFKLLIRYIKKGRAGIQPVDNFSTAWRGFRTYALRMRLLDSVGLLIVSALLAPAAESSETVRLYTNSDLERLGPPVASATQPIPGSSLDWVDLDRFLEREYARIDAERRHDLERRDADRRDRLARAVTRDEDFWIPSGTYWPFWGAGYPHFGGGWTSVEAPEYYTPRSGPHRRGAHALPDRPKRWNDLAGGKRAGGGPGGRSSRR